MKRIPRKSFVLIIAKISNPFETFEVKICVTINTNIIKNANNSRVNIPILEVIIKNQNEIPELTANDLNREEDVCIFISDK